MDAARAYRELIGTLPTRGTPDYVLWRDIKVDGHYAYIVSEISRSGLQVFDLRRLLTASTDTPRHIPALARSAYLGRLVAASAQRRRSSASLPRMQPEVLGAGDVTGART